MADAYLLVKMKTINIMTFKLKLVRFVLLMIVKLVKVKLDVRDATGLDNPVKQRTNVDVSILLLKELLDMK